MSEQCAIFSHDQQTDLVESPLDVAEVVRLDVGGRDLLDATCYCGGHGPQLILPARLHRPDIDQRKLISVQCDDIDLT
jgi:hypothetical protein